MTEDAEPRLFDSQPITRQQLALGGSAPFDLDEHRDKLKINRGVNLLVRAFVSGDSHRATKRGIIETTHLSIAAVIIDPTLSDADIDRLLEASPGEEEEPPEDDGEE